MRLEQHVAQFFIVQLSNAMTDLISSKQAMSSLEIAEVTGKRHNNIMRDISNLLNQGVNQLNFELVEYSDRKGEKRPCYNLTPKGVLILASGYNPLLREKIINRLEELEMKNKLEESYSHINPSDYTRQDLADIILESEQDLQAQDKIIAEQKDKIKELEERLERTRQAKIDSRFERIENVVAKMAGMMMQGIRTASVLPETAQTATPEPQAEDDDEEADVPRPMLVHEMRMRIKEEHGVVIPYRRMFALLAKMGWAVRNERYINRPGAVAVRKGYVLESDSKGVKDGAQFFTLRITEKGYRKFVDEVIGKGGLL